MKQFSENIDIFFYYYFIYTIESSNFLTDFIYIYIAICTEHIAIEHF